MAKTGRPPKSREQHKLEGTFRKDRHGEPDQEEELNYIVEEGNFPIHPDTIKGDGVKAWKIIAERALQYPRLYTWGDYFAMVQYCQAIDYISRAGQEEYFEIDDKGNKRVSADFKAWKDAVMVADRLSQRLGLDPSSRAALNFGKEDDKKEDDFSEWRV